MPRPLEARDTTTAPSLWWPRFDSFHRRAVVALLVAALSCRVASPAATTGAAGGGLLLVGGALIGLPHGSSDFVVAHRFVKPRLGAWWLPSFLIAYLVVTAAMLVSWRFVPGLTFIAFLVISAFHFGSEGGADERIHLDAALGNLARAMTPTLPIFLIHPSEVAGIVGLMCDRPALEIQGSLDGVKAVGLTLYVALLGWTVLRVFLSDHVVGPRSREAVEFVALALAAWLLPAFLTFAIYFCLVHAVRHMASLGQRAYPSDGSAALRLAAVIVLPSGLVCCGLLAATWQAVDGVLGTERLLALTLQITAALTLPHVVLEWCSNQTRAGRA